MSAVLLRRAVTPAARRVARACRPAAAPRSVPLAAAAAGSGVFAASFALRAHAMAAPSGGEQFQLPELPYAKDALEPHTTARTLEVHWGKHHAAYVANLNKAMQAEGGKGYAGMSLDQVVTKSFAGQHADGPIFNNAGQVRGAHASGTARNPLAAGWRRPRRICAAAVSCAPET